MRRTNRGLVEEFRRIHDESRGPGLHIDLPSRVALLERTRVVREGTSDDAHLRR